MASSWRYGKRSKYRSKVSQDPEDYYRLESKKSAAENAYDIYTALCCRDTRDTKRLFLLNGLAALCHQQHLKPKQAKANLGFSTEELLYCLSASLVHTFAQVRAAALRTMRYALATSKDVKLFNAMQLSHLLCRSIDVMLKNDDERVQALKLIRKMLAISALDISPVVVRCLVSLADTGMDDGDNLLRACLATLCEFAVLNPTLLIICGGVTALTRNVLECHNPRIAESLCGVLLYLLEWPQTRSISGVRLDCLAAPYCDFTYRLGIMDKNKDARELRYTSCRLALLSVLRSWTGTIEFCDPSKPSGLKAIVDSLYLNQLEVRKAILDLLYELLALPQPALTDDYAVALQAVDPSDFQDAWLLSNGFVAMEGRCILPSLAARAPNVCEQHLALQLYCFLETGLLSALVEVIVGNDAQLSVRATVLIGKILHLMHTHLPADISSSSSALPTLVAHAARGNQHASAAISALQSYQKMLRNRPASCSLFLDSIIQGGTLIQTRLFRRDLNAHETAWQAGHATVGGSAASPPLMGGTLPLALGGDRTRLDSVSSSDESNSQSSSSRRSSFRLKRKLLPFFENLRVNRLIKDSNVLSLADGNTWEWEVVTTILRSNLIRKLDDTTGKFLKRLVNYFKPSSNCFSHQDLAHGRTVPPFVTAGLDIIDWLLASNELESMRLITDFFSDISQHLLAVSTSNRAHDCLFSPQHMNNTMCQQYFLFIGRMCRSQKGITILTNTAVFEHLVNLVRTTEHVCYVKLIVSGLDYSLESATRKVLERALTTARTRSGRLYATQFLVVLLRARIVNFEVWGIPMIIQQTKDPDRSVVLAALDVLEEACHEKYYLEEIVSLWPNLRSLGDGGRRLMVRYYSLSRGLNHCEARIKEDIDYWKNGYNKRYVLLVEADTHASLTLHVRNEEGYYSRRNCNTRPIVIPPNIPAHLYGQMVQTAQGTTALRKHGDLPYLVDVISRGKCLDDAECLELKAAIWAVGHASTHSNGIEYFVESSSRIYDKLVILSTSCDVYSIRATCFSVLGLIGGTNAGANILFKLNWLSVRHDRNTPWPVHQPEDWMANNYTPVRHQYEEMPPYNYTGIEDQIDGSYYTGSYWNLLLSSSSTAKEGGASASSEAQDANTTVESGKTGEESAAKVAVAATPTPSNAVAAKSRTLPEGTYQLRHGKHQRSLSESKTTDVISLIGGGGGVGIHHQQQLHQHRIRYNSCTDSNTSGVSSCESVTVRGGGAVGGGMIVGDFQQFALSPIPSMSNLQEIQAPQTTMVRRTSLMGTSYLQNAISPVDFKGYAQLRSLRRHCRPVLSESAADFYDIMDELMSYESFRPRKSSFGESQRRKKVRSLDRQSSLLMFTQLESEELQVPIPTLAAPKFLSHNDSKGPCYAGICLPKHLLDLFPSRNLARTYVSRDIQDQDLMDINLLTAKQQFLNDSLNNEGGDESSVISSLSDVSSVSKRSKWLGAKHGRSNCLHCSRAHRNRAAAQAQRLDAGEPQQASVHACEMYTSAAAALVAAGMQATLALSRKSSRQQPSSQAPAHQQPQQQSSTSTIPLSDISFHSPESILSEESMPDRLTANILYNVQRLANPVSAKQSKMALLELKQKHPASFQDICLYSEVCKTLGRCGYRMNARRFLQELFLDLNFDTFYAEPLDILGKKEKRECAKGSGPGSTHRGGAGGSASEHDSLQKGLTALGDAAAGNAADVSATFELTAAATRVGNSTTGSGATTTMAHPSIVGHAHKTHLKSQPLASVCEASCENLLLEQSPRLRTEPVRAAVGDTDVAGGASEAKAQTNSDRSIAQEKSFAYSFASSGADGEVDVDEVDGLLQRYSTQPLQTPAVSTISTPLGSSNCSDRTSNSNRSSICTISHQPVLGSNLLSSTTNSSTAAVAVAVATTTPTTPIENENKKYTRGRFYTLELDLSCTKNKFPITDRNRGSLSATTPPALGATTSPTTQPVGGVAPLLQRQHSLGAGTSIGYISNYRSQLSAQPTSPTSTAAGAAAARTAMAPTAVIAASDGAETQSGAGGGYLAHLPSTQPATLTITKSLASSLAKPIGSLYCEKRLQSSKSEAVLTKPAASMTTTTAGNAGSITAPTSVLKGGEMAMLKLLDPSWFQH